MSSRIARQTAEKDPDSDLSKESKVASNREINVALMGLQKRAETNEPEKLVQTFVDVGPLLSLLSSFDHQVIYGRRGTGKTHLFHYLAESRRLTGDIALFVDMRTVGSSGGLYEDDGAPLTERGTRLLIDTFEAIYDQLLKYIVNDGEKLDDAANAYRCLERLGDELSSVKVVGEVKRVTSNSASEANSQSTEGSIGVSASLHAKAGATAEASSNAESATSVTEEGTSRHRVHFGAVYRNLQAFKDAVGQRRLWIMLDEWSAVPISLQPFLADFIRRAIFPVQGVTVKIAAIEQRSRFRVSHSTSDHIGIELGADASSDLDLDDFLVFGNDSSRAQEFFGQLLFKHLRSHLGDQKADELGMADSTRVIRAAFTQRNAFEELVRAAEGVPRDAINVASIAGQRALDASISMDHIRKAARTWYQRDKEAAVNANPRARELLHWIIDQVIKHRRARAFLLQQNKQDELILTLFDARVLHVVKRAISAAETPGVRFNVYGLDYGCYVDLMATKRAPEALFHIDGDEGVEGVEVPEDDYRSIRRAILDLDEFLQHRRR